MSEKKSVLELLEQHVKKALFEAQQEVDRLQADDKEFLCFEDNRGDIFYGGIAKGKRDLALEIVARTQALALSLAKEPALRKQLEQKVEFMVLGCPAVFVEETDYDKGYTVGYYDAKNQVKEILKEVFSDVGDM